MKLIVSIFAVSVAACGGKSATTTTTTTTTPPPAQPATTDAGSAATPTPAKPTCEVQGNTPDDVECALRTMDYYADQVCACTTPDCANGVTTEMSSWMGATDSKLGDVKPDAAQEQRMETISTRYEGCMSKAVGAGGGSGQ